MSAWFQHPEAHGSCVFYPHFCKDYTLIASISGSELAVGDIIPYGSYVREVTALEPNAYAYVCYYQSGSKETNGRVAYPTSSYVNVLRRPGTVAKRASSSAWNDKCKVCGKGMYVGFMTVEHEGGACT